MSTDISASDWISTVSSVVAAFAGVITLLTVYIGAMQLLSQSRMYRLGLSWRSLGPWRSTAAKSTLFGLQRRVFAPSVSLKDLVQKNWVPNFSFPIGLLPSECLESRADGKIQANTTWVNFLQALNLSPSDNGLFEMQDAAELVNGIVPMHWTGHDLVGFASILGFQSYEDCPSFKSPMPLPMQWSGPLGWIQFRSSANGCIAEFRRRGDLDNQIPDGLHRKQGQRIGGLSLEPHALDSRLWNSISGFCLNERECLYLGGADRHARPQENEDEKPLTGAQMSKYLMEGDYTDDDILRKLFGKKEDRPAALRRGVETRGMGRTQRSHNRDVPDFLDSVVRDAMDSTESSEQKQILRQCHGLLSVITEGELAYNRGLDIKRCKEYNRKYIEAEDIDHEKYPYSLGNMYMDHELLMLMKEALLLLRPDGFYFSPALHLAIDLAQMYRHVERQSNKLDTIFPSSYIDEIVSPKMSRKLYSTISFSHQSENFRHISFAMELCNELQRIRKTERVCFTVGDMRLIALSASDLKKILISISLIYGQDLVWAFIYSPKLFDDVLELLKTTSLEQILAATVTAKDESLDCAALLRIGNVQGSDDQETSYKIPCLPDAQFSGVQILASLSVVLITFYWIDTKWCTDVAAYETTMPQNVLMI